MAVAKTGKSGKGRGGVPDDVDLGAIWEDPHPGGCFPQHREVRHTGRLVLHGDHF